MAVLGSRSSRKRKLLNGRWFLWKQILHICCPHAHAMLRASSPRDRHFPFLRAKCLDGNHAFDVSRRAAKHCTLVANASLLNLPKSDTREAKPDGCALLAGTLPRYQEPETIEMIRVIK